VTANVDLDTWRADAACIGTPIRWWYPANDEMPYEAVARCQTCPVQSDCLEHALRYEKHGYWAGTSERARARLRRTVGIRLIEHDPDRIAPAALRHTPADEEDQPAWP
jgi:hypothetical protein